LKSIVGTLCAEAGWRVKFQLYRRPGSGSWSSGLQGLLSSINEDLYIGNRMIPISDHTQLTVKDVIFAAALLNQWFRRRVRPWLANLQGAGKAACLNLLALCW